MQKRKKLVKNSTRVRDLSPIDVQLVFQFLNVQEHVRALRVCTFWNVQGRQTMSWASRVEATSHQTRAMVRLGCTRPKTVIGTGLARSNFRPQPQWAATLRVLHMSNTMAWTAPTMTDDSAARVLQGLEGLQELVWHDLLRLPRDLKWPPKLRTLDIRFWITFKSHDPPWNPSGLPSSLESLSIAHSQAPTTHNTVRWKRMADVIPFHCPDLHTLVLEADGQVDIGYDEQTEKTPAFKSGPKLRKLHLKILCECEDVWPILTTLGPALEDFKMPEFILRPHETWGKFKLPLAGIKTLWIHHADDDTYAIDQQRHWIGQLTSMMPLLTDLFLYDGDNNPSAKLLAALNSELRACPHSYYDLMESCRHRGKGKTIHYIVSRDEDESDYDPESD